MLKTDNLTCVSNSHLVNGDEGASIFLTKYVHLISTYLGSRSRKTLFSMFRLGQKNVNNNNNHYSFSKKYVAKVEIPDYPQTVGKLVLQPIERLESSIHVSRLCYV
jgi:hypothetical protein